MISSSTSVVSWLAPSKNVPFLLHGSKCTWIKLWYKVSATPMLCSLCLCFHAWLLFHKVLNKTDGKSIDGDFCADVTWGPIPAPALLLAFVGHLHSGVMKYTNCSWHWSMIFLKLQFGHLLGITVIGKVAHMDFSSVQKNSTVGVFCTLKTQNVGCLGYIGCHLAQSHSLFSVSRPLCL